MRARGPAVCAAIACCVTSGARAEPRLEVENARSLMVTAIDSPNGRALGVLTGELATALTRRFGATSPVYIDVTTERRFSQPGCSRLNVRFWQEGVALPGSLSPRRQTVDFGINFCRDGQPPRSLR